MKYVVDILRYNNEGSGIAKVDGVTVFITGALIGEKVEIEITDKKKNYYIGKVVKIIDESCNRVKPICPYYDSCGGCNIMHMSYDTQLKFKVDNVKNIFLRQLGIDINPKIVSLEQFHYRNKITLKVDNNKIGFYSSKTHSIVDICECLISDNKMTDIIKKLRDFIANNNSKISEVMIRIGSTTLISIDNISSSLEKKFVDYMSSIVDSIYINKKIKYGDTQVMSILGLNYNVEDDAFFQVNTKMVEKLYSYVYENVDVGVNVLDLYCGVGTIGSTISKKCISVIGIEKIDSAIVNAKNNAVINGISNITFISGKVEDYIDKVNVDDIDLVVVDPPRAGCDKKTISFLNKISSKEIIYVSCNPITLARDISLLSEKYELKTVQLFDMFPNTYHVETVCILIRKVF